MKPVELDGRIGEGGGQLVRLAIGLAALTSTPVTITNIRGNRPKGGGLKSQHFASISWLAEVTDAHVEGLKVGSRTLTFVPRNPPTCLFQRHYKIRTESGPGSGLLILQAVLPFLLFASAESGEPIELEISGGTNVSFSPSFEYFDQLLMPTLEDRFGVHIEREVKARGWSAGPSSRGCFTVKVHPIARGQTLTFREPAQYKYPGSYKVESVDVTMLVPQASFEKLRESLVSNLTKLFPGCTINFKLEEDSHHDARWSVLLVARSSAGLRWGKDVLTSMSKKTKSRDIFVILLAKKLCKELYDEVMLSGVVDEHLQDQLVVFQALSAGSSSFPRGAEPETSSIVGGLTKDVDDLDIGEPRLRRERTHQPFGHGSLHSQTVRWVVGEMMPAVEFFNKGDNVKGAGISFQ